MQQNWKFQRGDIFFTHFGASTGSEQCGDRPAVILQNDVGNYHSPTLIVATMTSKAEKKVNQPTHCLLENAGLNMPSVVQAEQIFTIDKSRALKYLGHLTPEEMRRVDDAVRISLALNPMGSIQQMEPIRRSTALYAPPEVVDGKPPVYPYTPIKSSFENAGSIEEMMLYTELQSAVEHLQEMLGICRKNAYLLVKQNKIHSARVGRSYKIPKLCVVEYLLDPTTAPPTKWASSPARFTSNPKRALLTTSSTKFPANWSCDDFHCKKGVCTSVCADAFSCFYKPYSSVYFRVRYWI